jgi:muramoyltetrapeptide carboxypeptidase
LRHLNLKRTLPEKLQAGDEIRVIAAAQNLNRPYFTEEVRSMAKKNFQKLGLRLTFGKHVNEEDPPFLASPATEARLEDLHDAFGDSKVRAVITVIGGFNSNEMLPYLDYSLIRSNPKIFCGYSDITALENAIYAKTGLVTYSGPHWFDFGWNRETDYIIEYFKRCLFDSKPFEVKPSREWSDWSFEKGKPQKNEGMQVFREGECTGTIVGANLTTFLHLAGTEFMPKIRDTILFVEYDDTNIHQFNSELAALTLLRDFEHVRGMVMGRFRPASKIGRPELEELIRRNQRLDFPIIAGADFGHTTAKITFPIGGTARITAKAGKAGLKILEH